MIKVYINKIISYLFITVCSYDQCVNWGFNWQCDQSQNCPMSKYHTTNGSVQICHDVFGASEAKVRNANRKFIVNYGGKTLMNATKLDKYRK
jgi:hypothetical protein